jgi:hypothetical protein
MILQEKERIMKLCNCTYLEDLMTCVHIIQLKILSCVRVGNESKKITIDIPDFGAFLHKVYINVARKLYSNIYLFEIDIASLEIQKRNREFEVIVQACIMNTIRDSIPVETLLRQYIDESTEYEVKPVEEKPEVKPEVKPDPKPIEVKPVDPKPIEVKPIEVKPEFKVVENPKPEFCPVEPKSNISFNDELETFEIPVEEDTIRIGEDVPLNMLSFDELENATPCDIDLGIVEL